MVEDADYDYEDWYNSVTFHMHNVSNLDTEATEEGGEDDAVIEAITLLLVSDNHTTFIIKDRKFNYDLYSKFTVNNCYPTSGELMLAYEHFYMGKAHG